MMRLAELIANSPLCRRDTELLLQHVLGCNRTFLFTHANSIIDASQVARAHALLARVAGGEPLAYALGQRGFWSLELAVNRHVLIPRADTESLVEWALERVDATRASRALDLGTGCGAIALALKKERPQLAITATDISPYALAVAAGNGQRLDLPVTWRLSDWFAALDPGKTGDDPVDEPWPLIVSNPPYIAAGDPHLRQGDLPSEPRSALVSGIDGLDAIRHIVSEAPRFLAADGWLLLEHGFDQGASVRQLLVDRGFADIETRHDLGGQERVSGGRWRGL